jgi:hypothetical protein
MNRFIGSLAIVTTLSYHYYKIAVTIHTMNTTDCRSLPLLNWRSITNLLYVGSTRTAYKTLLQMYYCSNVYCPVAQQQVIVVYSLLLPAFAATRMFTESLLSNDDFPLLLRVCTCLPSYCLATVWSNPLHIWKELQVSDKNEIWIAVSPWTQSILWSIFDIHDFSRVALLKVFFFFTISVDDFDD